MHAASSELGSVSGGGSKNYTFDAIFGQPIRNSLNGGTFESHFGAGYPPTKTGYNFSKWVNLDQNQNLWLTEFNEGTEYVVIVPKTYYATWVQKKYTLTFNPNNGADAIS